MELLRLKFEINSKAPPSSIFPTSLKATLLVLPESSESHMTLKMNRVWSGSFLPSLHPSISFYHFTTWMLDEETETREFQPFPQCYTIRGKSEARLSFFLSFFITQCCLDTKGIINTISNFFSSNFPLNILNCKESGVCHIILDYFRNWR